MILEFTKSEMIDVLKQLGYEIAQKQNSKVKSRRTHWNKDENYVVIIDGNEKPLAEVFKQEILKSLIK